MTPPSRSTRILPLLLALLLGACASRYAYKPGAGGAPAGAAGAPAGAVAAPLPLKVAVVAFEDGTGDFVKKGSFFSGYEFNMAKGGINGSALNTGLAYNVSALPANHWAKAFADDLAASGAFRSVRLVFGRAELGDEDVVIEGTLASATFRTKSGAPDEFLLHLKAERLPGKTVAWEGDIARNAPRPPGLTGGCIIGSCVVERIHGYFGTVMRDMFSEARRELLRAVAPPPAEKKPSAPPVGESPEDVVNRILGKP
jgi:hypothetical protein